MKTIRRAALAAFAIAMATGSASAGACGGEGEASQPTGDEVTLFVYNNTGGEAGAIWSDTNGDMQFQNAVEAKGLAEFGTEQGSVWYIEATLDGEPHCLGPLFINGRGECHAALVQDADQFYLDLEGVCSN